MDYSGLSKDTLWELPGSSALGVGPNGRCEVIDPQEATGNILTR